jgi:hypothetical protein
MNTKETMLQLQENLVDMIKKSIELNNAVENYSRHLSKQTEYVKRKTKKK